MKLDGHCTAVGTGVLIVAQCFVGDKQMESLYDQFARSIPWGVWWHDRGMACGWLRFRGTYYTFFRVQYVLCCLFRCSRWRGESSTMKQGGRAPWIFYIYFLHWIYVVKKERGIFMSRTVHRVALRADWHLFATTQWVLLVVIPQRFIFCWYFGGHILLRSLFFFSYLADKTTPNILL